MQNVPRVVLLAALFTAPLLEAAVIYFLDDRSLRRPSGWPFSS